MRAGASALIRAVLIAATVAGAAFSVGPAGAAIPTAVAPTSSAVAAGAKAAPAGHPARAWLRAHRRELRTSGVKVGAKAIGIAPKELATELRSGRSIAQVAGEHGVSAQTVVNALVTAADAQVDQAVGNHRLTSAQATRIKSLLPARMARALSHVVK